MHHRAKSPAWNDAEIEVSAMPGDPLRQRYPAYAIVKRRGPEASNFFTIAGSVPGRNALPAPHPPSCLAYLFPRNSVWHTG